MLMFRNSVRSVLSRRRVAAAAAAVLVLGSASLCGCRSSKPNMPTEAHSHPPMVLLLAPGDELGISFMGADQLNMVQRIRRDGHITLHLIGDIKAAGKTVGQLQRS